MEIAVASGKGGTGKTFLTTNLARVLNDMHPGEITCLDCDVEEPNAHIFFHPQKYEQEEIAIRAPVEIDPRGCTGCGKCVEVCNFNARAVIKGQVLLFQELCHACGACSFICPEKAIIEGRRVIGDLFSGKKPLPLHYGALLRGEGGMTPRLITKVRERGGRGINILDAPPGTACPAVTAVKNTDLCVLVTDPTPFGRHDLQLAVNMVRTLNQEPVVIVNRAHYPDELLRDYCQKAEVQIIGEIPDDRSIARIYSRGELVVEQDPFYYELFTDLAEKILDLGQRKQPARQEPTGQDIPAAADNPVMAGGRSASVEEELVIISGKGGTGKTSLAAAFAALSGEMVLADCDVDASNLPLLLKPEIMESGPFSGGYQAQINQELCTACGICWEYCRFQAINKNNSTYEINPLDCEGCALCALSCPQKAVQLHPAINGRWYTSRIRFGVMAHAQLGLAEENSGRLVTLTRNKGGELASFRQENRVLIDGAPGTGCPVIASLTGARLALIVTEPTLSGWHDLKRITDLTQFFGVNTAVVINKADINPELAEQIENYCARQEIVCLGRLPYDEQMTRAQVEGKTIVEYAPHSPLADKIREIWPAIKDLLATGKAGIQN